MIITDVVGSLNVGTPEQAVELQLATELDFYSDGQGYCVQFEDAFLPFLMDISQQPLLPQITVKEYYQRHRIVKLRAKLKDTIDPSKSLIVQWFESAAKCVDANKGDLGCLKFIHPMPLTILNTFSMRSVRDAYENAQDELLWDIQEQIILPTLEYLRSNYPLAYFQGDDVAIFDADIHRSLIDEEFSVIEAMAKRCREWNIRFACYVPDGLLPDEMPTEWEPETIRQRLLRLSGTISWIFFNETEMESEDSFESKLRFVRKHKGQDVTLAIGLLESNREHYEDTDILSTLLRRTIEELNIPTLHISPIGGFKGVAASVAERKMRMLVELKKAVEKG